MMALLNLSFKLQGSNGKIYNYVDFSYLETEGYVGLQFTPDEYQVLLDIKFMPNGDIFANCIDGDGETFQLIYSR